MAARRQQVSIQPGIASSMTDLVRLESEFLLYTAPDGAVKVGVLFKDEAAWLTQKALAELFGVGVPAITKHLKNIKELNRIVSAYLDLAENQAQRGILMKMADWAAFLNSFLELSSYPILADKGKVSALEAKLKAEGEYEVYRERQDAEFVSDFDRAVDETKRLEGGVRSKTIEPGRAPPSATKPGSSRKGNRR